MPFEPRPRLQFIPGRRVALACGFARGPVHPKRIDSRVLAYTEVDARPANRLAGLKGKTARASNLRAESLFDGDDQGVPR